MHYFRVRRYSGRTSVRILPGPSPGSAIVGCPVALDWAVAGTLARFSEIEMWFNVANLRSAREARLNRRGQADHAKDLGLDGIRQENRLPGEFL